MRYLSQRYAMPYREVMGVMTDIGTEVSKQSLYFTFLEKTTIMEKK